MRILLAIVVAGVTCAIADAVVSERSPRRSAGVGRLPAHPGGGSPDTPADSCSYDCGSFDGSSE